MRAAALHGNWRRLLKGGLILVVLIFPLGRALGGQSFIGSMCIWIGSFWLGAMFYGLMFALFFDLIRWLDRYLGWLPKWALANRLQSGRLMLAVATVTLIMLLTGGHIRSLYPVVREVTIELVRFAPDVEEYNIVVIADSHLGILVGERRIQRIVQMINDLGPDLCLIVGDLIDENAKNMQWIVEPLQQLEAADGVYAVTGNHEFYSGIKEVVELVEQAGIMVLQDTMVQIGSVLNIAGLNDESGGRQYQLNFKPIAFIIKDMDSTLPVILMHHTPARMVEAQQAGVDLMLSGHSHGGQLWPTRNITKATFGVDQGLTMFGDMYFYLTNGVGTWGPPMRIGAAPEIVWLTLKPKTNTNKDIQDSQNK